MPLPGAVPDAGVGAGGVQIPKVEVQVSGTFQSNPGIPPVGATGTDVQAQWVVPNAIARQALGRDLSGAPQTSP